MISAERDWWLSNISGRKWTQLAMDSKTKSGCYEIFRILLSAVVGEAVQDILKPLKRKYCLIKVKSV